MEENRARSRGSFTEEFKRDDVAINRGANGHHGQDRETATEA